LLNFFFFFFENITIFRITTTSCFSGQMSLRIIAELLKNLATFLRTTCVSKFFSDDNVLGAECGVKTIGQFISMARHIELENLP